MDAMRRVRITLPEWQIRFLTEQADREGVSVAEVIRRIVAREAAEYLTSELDGVWSIAGIAEDAHPLIDGKPVSERPELYL